MLNKIIRLIKSERELLPLWILRKLGALLYPGYRFKWPQLDWWGNASFNAYLDRFGERNKLNTDRRWMLYQLVRLIEKVPGDTAECGVFKGASSFLIINANSISAMTRIHFAFDSFQGLSDPGSEDGHHWSASDLSFSEIEVVQNLGATENIRLMRGWIPERFHEVSDRQFAFVHIDVDLYRPTLDSIAFFYSRMASGGVLVCDDYGFSTCPGATLAIDEFLVDKPEKMLALPDGGGFFIKGISTSTTLRLD